VQWGDLQTPALSKRKAQLYEMLLDSALEGALDPHHLLRREMMRRLFLLLAVLTLAAPLMFIGCSGDDGAQGPPGTPGTPGDNGTTPGSTARPETCGTCHSGAGEAHQASYDLLYQDGVILVSNLTYAFDNNNDVVKFNIKKNGVGVDCSNTKQIANLNIYFAPYDNTGRFEFNPPAERQSIKGTLVGEALTGLCTSTNPSADNVALDTKNGVIVVYGYDEQLGSTAARVKQVRDPYAALLFEGTVDYVSAANVDGCQKCHTVPYLKHGNIYGRVAGDNTTDFITCKACHLDNGPGGHQFWQELVDDPELAAKEFNNQLTDDEKAYIAATYAYKTRLMNDVHMSHAMEFEYPQSMANCATCHAGKLDLVFTDANLVFETCKSCHPVNGGPPAGAEKPQPALKTVMPSFHFTANDNVPNASHTTCSDCHSFDEFHTGYDPVIYAEPGVKYSEKIVVTIDDASFDNNVLSFTFSAAGSAGGLNAADITPTVLVGLYGYDTKDYIVGPHEGRQLEWTVGSAAHPRIQLVSSDNGAWVVEANLSDWAGIIDNGAVTRVEIAVMPNLQNPALPAGDNVVALNAPSRTFSLASNSFVNNYYEGTNAIVKVTAGCNNCHDALATTFHTPDRGGNIVVCRLCHITKSGASHLEMQSRSIDSYVHTIHSFQPFDYGRALDNGGTDFDNAVQVMFLDLVAESTYPVFGLTNCESCHNDGKFNVPDQTKSLPGILSASWSGNGVNPTFSSTINGVPAWVTGPGSRACGACHRAERIKENLLGENMAGSLATFNQHTEQGGYLATPAAVSDLINAINTLSPVMYDGILVTLP